MKCCCSCPFNTALKTHVPWKSPSMHGTSYCSGTCPACSEPQLGRRCTLLHMEPEICRRSKRYLMASYLFHTTGFISLDLRVVCMALQQWVQTHTGLSMHRGTWTHSKRGVLNLELSAASRGPQSFGFAPQTQRGCPPVHRTHGQHNRPGGTSLTQV